MYDNQVCNPEAAAVIARAQTKSGQAFKRRSEDRQAWIEAHGNFRSLVEALPKWEEQVYYFGNGTFPSEAVYRVYGQRIQARVDFLTIRDSDHEKPEQVDYQYVLSPEDLVLLAKCEDVRLQVAKPPYVDVSLFGWLELTTPEEFEMYETHIKYHVLV